MDSPIVNFGKYKGKTIPEIYEIDQQYCKWLYPQEILIGEYPEIKKFLDSKFLGTDMSYVMTWGKHVRRTIVWIKTNDSSYFDWLMKSDFVDKNCKSLKKALVAL